MKKLIIVASVVFCASCATAHNPAPPQANLSQPEASVASEPEKPLEIPEPTPWFALLFFAWLCSLGFKETPRG